MLGSGGMGRVYLGTAEGRYAAVKRVLPVLAEDEDFLRHFGHELDNLARLPGGVSAKLLASDRTARPRGSPPSTSPASPSARRCACTAARSAREPVATAPGRLRRAAQGARGGDGAPRPQAVQRHADHRRRHSSTSASPAPPTRAG
ncbi:hypothetical protein ACFQ60_23540 [Streptomyces zhihengii]